MKRSSSLIIASSVIALLAIVVAFSLYFVFLTPQFQTLNKEYIYIDKNDNIESVYSKIEKSASPKYFKAFKLLSSYKKYDQNIKPGRYKLSKSDNFISLFRKLRNGNQSPVTLIISNVRTLDEFATVLAGQLMEDSLTFVKTLTDTTYIRSMGYKPETFMSMFIPNSYYVFWDTSPKKLFNRLKIEHRKFWNEKRTQKAKAMGLTPEQVYALASIVDEETNAKSEKPIVAGLYYNRLQRNILLQADPTIKFALKDFTIKRILNKHLKIDSPYNTYKYAGLPPGPIRMSSIVAIDAVLNYRRHNYIYMCAKEDFSGLHNFATNLAQHNRNARRYQNALNKRKIFK